MKVEADGFSFDLKGAMNAFVFDEKDPNKPTFHGGGMKAVDIIAEFDDCYLFVEVKDFHNPDTYEFNPSDIETHEINSGINDLRGFTRLKEVLKYKYRDSYLYRHAEDKVDKPIEYICLLNLRNRLNRRMQKALTIELPVGKISPSWQRSIVNSCTVVNVDKWNQKFRQWPVKKID